MAIQDQMPKDQIGDLARRLGDIERTLRELAGGNALQAATIGTGGITVKGGAIMVTDSTGKVAIRIGVDPSGYPRWTFVDNTTGATLITMGTNASGQSFWRFNANNDVELLSSDANSGNALARPVFNGDLGPVDYRVWPKTTSTTFVDLWTGWMYRANPRLQLSVGGTTDASGTTGEIRVCIDGTPVAGPWPVAFGIGWTWTPFVAVPGTAWSTHNVTIQGRVLTGTGSLCAGFGGWVTG